MTKPANHLLHDDDDTAETTIGDYYYCGATWFPFAAGVRRFGQTQPFVWQLHFIGSFPGSLVQGEAATWSAACEWIRASQQAMLLRLKEQLR